jgi:hypothetical protein
MRVTGDYSKDDYVKVEGLVPAEVCTALCQQLEMDIHSSGKTFDAFAVPQPLTRQATVEITGHQSRPLLAFLWGLTPIVSELTGRDLLPSFDYFRIYPKDDICRVHSDRPSCEHSISLTLAYSDGKPWNLQIGTRPIEDPESLREDFGDEPFSSIAMNPGDAVLYRGARRRHGRVEPNPNAWSAHLFLHWVERGGAQMAHAFDAALLKAEWDRVSAAQRRPVQA